MRLSAYISPSSPATRETGKDRHSRLVRAGGESQNRKCTASISREKNFLVLVLVQQGAFWNISARGKAVRLQASSLLEARDMQEEDWRDKPDGARGNKCRRRQRVARTCTPQ
ncbi:hypothetical protein V8C34DRAFT_290381 [Trichoderma compactum]